VLSFMEDDNCRTQRRQVYSVRRVETLRCRLELSGEMSTERDGRIAEEMKQVAMETVGTRTIDYHIRHCQDLAYRHQ